LIFFPDASAGIGKADAASAPPPKTINFLRLKFMTLPHSKIKFLTSVTVLTKHPVMST